MKDISRLFFYNVLKDIGEGLLMEKERILDFLKRLSEGIATMFGKNCEVVIHDMMNFESSVIHIKNGHVTGRKTGDPFNVLGIHEVDSFFEGSDMINHQGKTKTNDHIKSSTFHIKGDDYHYAIGINFDFTDFAHMSTVIKDLTKVGGQVDEALEEESHIDQTLEAIYDEAVKEIGKPVPFMKKEDRVRLIQYMDEKGAFSIHKSIPIVSEKMNISRYTIYNYLKEIRDD